jgi:hypothetical protein
MGTHFFRKSKPKERWGGLNQPRHGRNLPNRRCYGPAKPEGAKENNRGLRDHWQRCREQRVLQPAYEGVMNEIDPIGICAEAIEQPGARLGKTDK